MSTPPFTDVNGTPYACYKNFEKDVTFRDVYARKFYNYAGAAPLEGAIVTATSTPSLPNSRVLTAGDGIEVVDGGAGSTITVGATGNLGGINLVGDAGLLLRIDEDNWRALDFFNSDNNGFQLDVDLDNNLFVLELDDNLNKFAKITGTGFPARTEDTEFEMRTMSVSGDGLSITDGDGVAGNPTFSLDNDVKAIEDLDGTGLYTRTGTDAWAARQIAVSGAGLSVTNPAGTAGDPTLSLSDDVAAIEALNGTGFPSHTGANTWAERTHTSGNGVTVTNGNGVSGNPTYAIAPFDKSSYGIFSAIKNGTMTISNNTATRLTNWTVSGTETFSSAAFDTSTGIFTAPQAGKYRVHGNITWLGSASGVRQGWISINGAVTGRRQRVNGSSSDFQIHSLYALLDLAVNDTVALRVFQNSGSNATIQDIFNAGEIATWFSVEYCMAT